MGLIMAFDYGTSSIGVAIGQSITKTAHPINALKTKNGQPNWDDVLKLLNEWLPEKLVIGLPLNMDGTPQEMTAKAQKFAQRLHGRFGKPIFMQDERLTTVEAKQNLFDQNGFKSLNKAAIDSESAVIILENWFSEN